RRRGANASVSRPTGPRRNHTVASVLISEACLRSFSGRQAGVEIAPETLRDHSVGMIVRVNKPRIDRFAVPNTRPLLEALLVHERYVFRVVKHGGFRKLNSVRR